MRIFVLSLFLLLLLLALSSELTSSSVIEIDGKQVSDDPSFVFFTLPVLRGRTFFNVSRTAENDTCRFIIARDPSELHYAYPIEIPTPERISILSTTVDVKEKIHDPSNCSDMPSSWTVVEELGKTNFLKIGNLQRNVDGWFKLEPNDEDTHHDKLLFCHRSDLQCGQVGFFVDKTGNAFLIAILQFHGNQTNKAIT